MPPPSPLPPTTRRSAAPRPRSGARPRTLFQDYRPLSGVYDELFAPEGKPRPEAAAIVRLLETMGVDELRTRQLLADEAFLRSGITFSVYSDNRGEEKIFPFDLIPRTLSAADWERLNAGLIQRIHALNAFLGDVYGEGRIMKEGRVPRDLVVASKGYLKSVCGIRPREGIYVHVAGIDLIRCPDGSFAVLEDNIRTPSGVSYVLENRLAMKRANPQLFDQTRVHPVDSYPMRLREALESISPAGATQPHTVVLTPGPCNSAYFEHSFLARRMGCALVEGQDLFTWQDRVYVKTTRGPAPVDVIYRRVDDDFLDPEAFRPDSLLGVPGLMKAYASGNVALANAIGNGVGDDKAIYPYVPEMIRFYLSQTPILPQVETFILTDGKKLAHVLANLATMVTKTVDGSGGYGMVLGPLASRRQLEEQGRRIRANPRGYIAQPLLELSTCPTWTGTKLAPRRVDFRPYIVTGATPWVLPGGLTRVALVDGSYVVNSSQGGGSKDTWVLEAPAS